MEIIKLLNRKINISTTISLVPAPINVKDFDMSIFFIKFHRLRKAMMESSSLFVIDKISMCIDDT